MYIGTKDAVEIYAKACRARYGALARRLVTEQAQALLTKGDRSGAEIWRQVAVEIEKAEERDKPDEASSPSSSWGRAHDGSSLLPKGHSGHEAGLLGLTPSKWRLNLEACLVGVRVVHSNSADFVDNKNV
jgi:hypothetical protein